MNPELLHLKRCDLAVCQAMCCYDGAYLEPDEPERLRAVVAAHPEHFAGLFAGDGVTEGQWRGVVRGSKTAVRPHAFSGSVLPAHFESTRCVFTEADGKCALQTLAVAQGQHPWAYKPRVCWLHPFHRGPFGPEPPPMATEDDPHQIEGYAGYTTFTHCGRHTSPEAGGEPWFVTCREEMAYAALVLEDLDDAG